MSTFSARIFAAFWALLVVALAIAIAAVLWRSATSTAQPSQAEARLQQVAALLSDNNMPGLELLVASLEAPLRPVFIVDESGRDVLGRRIPKRLENAIRSARTTPGSEQIYWPGPFPIIEIPSGKRYRLVTIPPPGSPFAQLAGGDLLFVIAALLLATGLASALLARHLAAPLRKLEQLITAAGRGEAVEQEVLRLARRNDEVGSLAGSYAQTSSSLEELARQRQQLLRELSHELRTPLTRLRVALGRTDDQVSLPDSKERIATELRRLDALISEILDLSRLDRHTRDFNPEPCDLLEIAAPIITDAAFEARAAGKAVTTNVTDCSEDITVSADTFWLSSAIENVVRNAIAATPPGGSIHVQVERMGSEARVTVRDQGRGVDPAELERLFEPFYRSPQATGKGNGIGLAIAARVACLCGGRIHASLPVDGGLEVKMSLPVTRPN